MRIKLRGLGNGESPPVCIDTGTSFYGCIDVATLLDYVIGVNVFGERMPESPFLVGPYRTFDEFVQGGFNSSHPQWAVIRQLYPHYAATETDPEYFRNYYNLFMSGEIARHIESRSGFLRTIAPLAVYGGALAVGGTALMQAFAPAAAAGASTATLSGGELAALVEAGTVGAEGAFLEAAALSGGTVTYSTTTGALLSATLPTGGSVLFDPSVDAFAQLGVDPTKTILQEAAPIVRDQLTVDVLETLPQAEQAVVEQVMTENATGTLIGKAGEAVQAQLVQMGKSMLAGELKSWLAGGGDSGAAPGSFRAAQDAGLPIAPTSGKLQGATWPLLIGAAIGLAGMFLFARRE